MEQTRPATQPTQDDDDDVIIVVNFAGWIVPTSRVTRRLAEAENLVGLLEEHVADEELVVTCERAITRVLEVAAIPGDVTPCDASLDDALRASRAALETRRGSHTLLDATLRLLSMARWWYAKLRRAANAAAAAVNDLALPALETDAEPEGANETVAAVGDATPRLHVRTLIAAPAAPPVTTQQMTHMLGVTLTT